MKRTGGPSDGRAGLPERAAEDAALISALESRLQGVRGQRVWIGGHDRNARRLVEAALGRPHRTPSGTLDGAIVTPRHAEEADYFVGKTVGRVRPGGVIHVVWVDTVGRLSDKDSDVEAAALRKAMLKADLEISGAWDAPPLHGVWAVRRSTVA